MIATDTHQRPSYVDGEILSIYWAPQAELPGIGRFLSQGAAAGAFIPFLVCLTVVLSQLHNHWNFLILFVLPFFSAAGMVFGMFEGLAIWGCSRLARGRLDAPISLSDCLRPSEVLAAFATIALVNIPIAYAIRKEISIGAGPIEIYVLIGYLAVWAAFLLTFCSPIYSALAFLKKELRYYLID
jgi:hypothetical protein